MKKFPITILDNLSQKGDPTLLKKSLNFVQQLADSVDAGTPATATTPAIPGKSPLSSQVVQSIMPQVQDMIQRLLNSVAGSVDKTSGASSYTGLVSYLMEHKKDVNKIAKELSGISTSWIPFKGVTTNKSIPTREELIKKHSSMDPDIVGAIYDQDQIMKENHPNSELEDVSIMGQVQNLAQVNNTAGNTSLNDLTSDELLATYLSKQIIATPLFNKLLM